MLDVLLDLILPRECGGCGVPGEALCPGCRPAGPTILVGTHPVPITAAGRYEHGLRVAVLGYKERGRGDLVPALADLLARAARDQVRAGAVLVPVPSARAAARRRGGDHVRRLARRAGRELGVRTLPALRLRHAVHDSAGLGVAERRANLAGAMAARRAPPGAVALVVDDIVTTGTTLAEATRALQAAGWPVAGAAVVASTPRWAVAGSGAAAR